MKSAITLSLLAAALALSATSALASGDPVAGKAKAVTCVACHGQDGNAVDPQYPRLAGQYADYMVQALHEYKTGQRDNPIMKGFASQLSDKDIDDVAAYFSQMPGKLDNLKHDIQGSH
jgi:cytochrome c553